jgi:hypothetical protein
MTQTIRRTALAIVSAIGLSLFTPLSAQAGSEGRRNTSIGLGAVAIYGIAKKKPLIAGLAGGGAIYSYMSSRQAKSKERKRRAMRNARRRVVYYRNGHRYVRYR